MNKLIIAAGTGFLGEVLATHFKDNSGKLSFKHEENQEQRNNIKYVTGTLKPSLAGKQS